MVPSRIPPIFKRHAAFAIVIIASCMILLVFGIGEIIARIAISYNPRYYTIVHTTDQEIQFPFGVIKINSLGYPDDEFDLEDPRPRVGYVGDSVTYGIGAGHGYRFSDLIEEHVPQYQHMTLGSVGEGFTSRGRIDRIVDEARSLGIDLLIYFYNLNDTLPHAEPFQAEPAPEPPWYLAIFRFLQRNTNFVRQHSFLINWIRYRVRILLVRLGIEQTGYRAFELFPSESGPVIDSVAVRINYLARSLQNSGTAFAVVLLPYEMQISSEAERTYAAMGVHWEQEFIARGLQERLREALAPEIPVYDAYEAFIEVPSDRDHIAVGQFFVFDRGDMLDWNHPSRAGHARIADWLANIPLLAPPLGGKGTPNAMPGGEARLWRRPVPRVVDRRSCTDENLEPSCREGPPPTSALASVPFSRRPIG